ncbi:MAG: sulfate ABC transporter ATP-binding protein, partial [Acinetobacter johnsonii]
EGEDATNVHVREREVGFVFQHYALFRHMTVFDNIAFGLRVRPRATRPSEAEIKKRVTRLLDLVQLGFLADRYPAQLSGGQRQRIALARALAVEPRVLLLDEPFGALDAKVRKELRRWLRTLHDELHITSIFVTHDQEEALEVADQIIVMNKGNVEQIGSPREVYEKPATPFVFDFLGQANRFEGQNNAGTIQIGEDRIQLDSLLNAPSGDVIAFARPDELRIHAQPQDNAIQATFVRELWIAGKVVAELHDRQGKLIEISLTSEEAKLHQFRPNQTVWLSPSNLHLFAKPAA